MLLSSHLAAILTGPILTGLLQTGDASIEPMDTCKAALPHQLMTSPLLGIDENEIISAPMHQ
jgi:hypothetical protein